MNQIINIFRKDARHHWGEIALCQAALVARVWHEVHGWTQPDTRIGFARFWTTTIEVLLPIAWWILIVRVVQSESLVGDRQFWTTRPYEWKKLLAAKALFVLVFVNLPLLIAQLFLMTKAGFTPARHITGILWMQLLLSLMPLLPIAALATVTRNMAHSMLSLLCVVLFGATMIALTEFVPQSAIASTDDSDWLQLMIVVVASAMTIWLQYAHRKAGRARMFLAIGGAAILVVFAATPRFVQGEREYPLPAARVGATFQTTLADEKPVPPKDVPDKDEDVEIGIPIVASGLQDGTLAQIKAVRLSFVGGNGVQWDSNWQSNYNLLLPGRNSWTQTFKLSYKIYERLNAVPGTARVSVAIAVFRDQDVIQIEARDGEFAIPQVGTCRIDPRNASEILCNSPLVRPATLLARTEQSASTCPSSSDEDPPPGNSTPYAWEWNGDQGPAEYGINPVESFTLYLSNWRSGSGPSARICPGTPLRFSFPKLIQRTRAEFASSGLKLEDYRKEHFRFGAGGVVIRTKPSGK